VKVEVKLKFMRTYVCPRSMPSDCLLGLDWRFSGVHRVLLAVPPLHEHMLFERKHVSCVGSAFCMLAALMMLPSSLGAACTCHSGHSGAPTRFNFCCAGFALQRQRGC
jgi:hypothetical protein